MNMVPKKMSKLPYRRPRPWPSRSTHTCRCESGPELDFNHQSNTLHGAYAVLFFKVAGIPKYYSNTEARLFLDSPTPPLTACK